MKPLEETARAAADEINISYEEPRTIIARHFRQRDTERDAEIEAVAKEIDNLPHKYESAEAVDAINECARIVRTELLGGKP